MKLTFAIRNRAALTVVLGRKGKVMKARVAQAVQQSGQQLQLEVRQRSPVDTGFMRGHVRPRFSEKGLHLPSGLARGRPKFPGEVRAAQ